MLAGTTIVSGASSRLMRVHLPKEASLSARVTQNPDFEAAGQGRVVGVLLVAQSKPSAQPLHLSATRWSFCGMDRCGARTSTELVMAGGGTEDAFDGDYYRLAPGDYDLYLVADDSPVTVKLRFRGLTGTTRLRPSRRADVLVRNPSVLAQAAEASYVAQDEVFVPSRGLFIQGLRETYDMGIGSRARCIAPVAEAGIAPLAAATYGCTSGRTYNLSNRTTEWTFFAGHPAYRGRWRSYFSFTWAGDEHDVDFLDLWVSFRGDR